MSIYRTWVSMKAVPRRTGTATCSATMNGIRNVVFLNRTAKRTAAESLGRFLLTPYNQGRGASRTTCRVQLGGRSAILPRLYPEHVSPAIVRGLKAFPSVAIEPRTL